MKASRAAIKVANNLTELAQEVASMREQLDRLEAAITALTAAKETAPKLPVDEGTTVLKARAK